MRRTATMTLWDQLWHSHDQVKNLLMCALPTSSTGGSSSRSEANGTQGSSGHSPRPPAYNRAQKIGLVLGPLLFAMIVMFFHPADLSFEGRMVLATTLWVAVWWITEAIPIPVTSLLPIILLVWIDPSRGRLALLHVIVLNAYGSGSEGLSATVDLSGIRGLGTDLSSLRRGATLVYKRGSLRPGGRRPHRRVRGSPTGPTLPEP